jgi:hypothetical protein
MLGTEESNPRTPEKMKSPKKDVSKKDDSECLPNEGAVVLLQRTQCVQFIARGNGADLDSCTLEEMQNLVLRML